jgi:hypothetical protein
VDLIIWCERQPDSEGENRGAKQGRATKEGIIGRQIEGSEAERDWVK